MFKHISISLAGKDDQSWFLTKPKQWQRLETDNEEDEGLGELMESKKKEDSADRMGLTVQTRLSSSTQIWTCCISMRCYDDSNQRYRGWCSITWWGHPLSWGIRSPITANAAWSGTHQIWKQRTSAQVPPCHFSVLWYRAVHVIEVETSSQTDMHENLVGLNSNCSCVHVFQSWVLFPGMLTDLNFDSKCNVQLSTAFRLLL